MVPKHWAAHDWHLSNATDAAVSATAFKLFKPSTIWGILVSLPIDSTPGYCTRDLRDYLFRWEGKNAALLHLTPAKTPTLNDGRLLEKGCECIFRISLALKIFRLHWSLAVGKPSSFSSLFTYNPDSALRWRVSAGESVSFRHSLCPY